MIFQRIPLFQMVLLSLQPASDPLFYSVGSSPTYCLPYKKVMFSATKGGSEYQGDLMHLLRKWRYRQEFNLKGNNLR